MKPERQSRTRMLATVFAFMLVLAVFVIFSALDLMVSGLFFEHGRGFYLAHTGFFMFMECTAHYTAWGLGWVLALLCLIARLKRKVVLGLGAKGWGFLFLALLIGPALVANGIFKDHWGRARPREVSDFGGAHVFSPALEPQQFARHNGSFVSGDAAFGFYLPAFAYLVPRRRNKTNLSRRVFWCGMGAGALFGFARLAIGAHFLSDILFAAFFMLTTSALLHMAMYGRKETAIYWRDWLFERELKNVT